MSKYPNLSTGSRRVLSVAKVIAKDCYHDFLTTEHLLLGVLEQKTPCMGVKKLADLGVDVTIFKSFIITNLRKYKGDKQPSLNSIEPSDRVLTMFEYASCIAQELDSNVVDVDHILLSILVSDSGTGNNLFKLKNIDTDLLYDTIYTELQPKEKKRQQTKQKQSSGQSSETDDTDQQAQEDKLLQFATDLTDQAFNGDLDPVVGRDDELKSIIHVLCRRKKNNPVLIGEPGVGKTAIVELLAQKIVEGDVPARLRNKTIYSLDLARMVAGTIYRGQFEERIKEMVAYVSSRDDIILFIDELHTLVGAGSAQGSMDASNILKPALARGTISCIGATTVAEYKEFIESDGALDRRFQSTYVSEPTVNDTVEILKGVKSKYEMYHNVRYNNNVLTSIANLTDRYITDKRFPDKAIDILDEIGARLRCDEYQPNSDIIHMVQELKETTLKKQAAVVTQQFEKGLQYRAHEQVLASQIQALDEEVTNSTEDKTIRVTVDDICDLISDKTGIPVNAMTQTESVALKKLESKIQNIVIGQDPGIQKIVSAIKRSRAGVSDPDKPICSLLFLGPTGVGKTHLARTLGEEYFQTESFKQFDMSEFSERHSISKLIGSPPGYVGYGEGGLLTEFVRHNPYSVILFDEIEKAHPEVLQIFLQLLEYGMVTDSEGLEVNFRNTIIVMTSNIGSHKFDKGDRVGFNPGNTDISQAVISEIQKIYAPELLNRIDEIIVFKRLKDKHMLSIVKLMLSKLKKTVRANTKHVVYFEDSVHEHILSNIDTDIYGARPMKRYIVTAIENKLAEQIMTLTDTKSHKIVVDLVDGDISVKVLN